MCFIKKAAKSFLYIGIFLAVLYGGGRLYYFTTAGFTLGNITYDLPYNSCWDCKPSSLEQEKELQSVWSQKFHYLGKGCQSYVFASEDGRYVLKFVKYQRFRPRPWLEYLTFLPGMPDYLRDKIEKKQQKLEGIFTSWKIAYEFLPEETGVVYVHLNKSKNLNKRLVIFDKMGLQYNLNSDDYEFLMQRRAKMLCPTLDGWMNNGELERSKTLLTALIDRIVKEYQNGYADNDHALMQNTGVLDEQPVHVDVGQFVKNPRVLDPAIWHQELFNKTWKFRKWLEKKHPELASHLVLLLKSQIGEAQFSVLKPRLNKAEMGVLSHHE